MTFARVAADADIWDGEMLAVRPLETPVLLLRLNGELHAYEDRCAHVAFPMSRGRLVGNLLVCAAHEWCYEADTGRGLNPAGVALRKLAVEVRRGEVFVDVEPRGGIGP